MTEECNAKLLLTEFNRIIPKESIAVLSIQQNRLKKYAVLLETKNGEFVTAAIASLPVAQRLLGKLNRWFGSGENMPFHIKYELEKIHSCRLARREAAYGNRYAKSREKNSLPDKDNYGDNL